MTTGTTIDLRSDTMTRPDAAMRRAMAEAEVGDDVWGEDPTVRRLEEEGAEAMGMEAALFVPSGIMGNSIALGLHAPRGSELLCDHQAHITLYEMAAMAALWGILARPLPSADGLPDPDRIRAAVIPQGGYRVPTGAIALENSHNQAGGRVFSVARLAPVVALARERGLPLHVDGARIFNAAVALATTPARLLEGFSSVSFCLSKGLGAPVGSMLCGGRDFIAEARQRRRLLGGAMRQAGVIAAAGLVALREGPARLADDHEHARRLAIAIAATDGLEIDLAAVESNIVIFRVVPVANGAGDSSARWVEAATARGLLSSPIDAERVRLVTHRDVDSSAIARAVEIVQTVSIGI
ncbi:MAG: GntG family PLP-dependent aldolase [Thermoanaerobaculia bacterium]